MLDNGFFSQFVTPAGASPVLSAKLMSFEPARPPWPGRAPLVLVMVAPRLLDPAVTSPSTAQITQRLRRLKDDLALDGYASRFILLDIARDGRHRDGAGVLAIRRMLQAARQAAPALAGALLIGDFPEAMLVRSWMWKKTDKTEINKQQVNLWLRIVPEIVADRSDIVLQDLTGRWDSLYVEGPVHLDQLVAAPDADVPATWPEKPVQFRSSCFVTGTTEFQDFFHIRDERIRDLVITPTLLTCRIEPQQRHPELGPGDALSPNPIARPDIHVSRINPRSSAAGPSAPARDVNGQWLLAPDGRPTTAVYPTAVNDVGVLTVPDPVEERRLLIAYLDRNHRWRNGQIKLPSKAQVIAYPQREFTAEARRGFLAPAFGAANVVPVEDARMLDYVAFLRAEAPLKMVVAHSNGTLSVVGASNTPNDAVDRAVGGRPFRWVNSASGHGTRTWSPSLAGIGGYADIRLNRSLWASGLITERQTHFLIHQGCQVNSPELHATKPYSDPAYGRFQNAESLMFHTGGLAVLTRAKLFYDEPRGFVEAFAARRSACFGDGLFEYARRESLDARLNSVASFADCKRVYPWSIIGDWSLRLKPVELVTNELAIAADRLTIAFKSGSHIVTNGSQSLIACRSAAEAERVIAVLRHYRIDRVGYVDRPRPSLTYWLSGGRLPTGAIPGDDVIAFDRWQLRAFKHGSQWMIGEGPNDLLLKAKSEADAEAVLRTLRRLEARAIGYVRRPGAAMTYLLR